MLNSSQVVQGVSDTSHWVAYFRALETERSDALFRDPHAHRLAAGRGVDIAHRLPDGTKNEWAWATRTYLFDQFISSCIDAGADLVLNLAAGLDTRPYRMQLTSNLQWIEVDLPDVIHYKQEVLSDVQPVCHLERVALDLSDVEARKRLFERVAGLGKRIVVVCEGLLIYFTEEEVKSLAASLAANATFTNWIVDLASPGQLRMMQRTTGKMLSNAGAAFKFGPRAGPAFFADAAWQAVRVEGMLKTAAKLNRAPIELLSLLPEPKGEFGEYPWTGVCLMHKSEPPKLSS